MAMIAVDDVRNAGFFLTALFVPSVYWAGITGAWLESGWPVMWVLLPLLVAVTPIRMTPVHWSGAVFAVCVGVSFLWAPVRWYAVEECLKFSCVALAFLIGASPLIDPRWFWRGLALGVGVSGPLAVAQYWRYWNPVFEAGSPAGLFVNPSSYSVAAAFAVLGVVCWRTWYWTLPLLVPGVVLTYSRAGWGVLVVAAVLALWRRSRLLAASLSMAGVVFFLFFTDASAKLSSSLQRFAIWRDTLDGLTWTGHGAGSFGALYPAYATRVNTMVERAFHAHSDYLELAFEFGIAAVFLLGAIFAALARAAPRERVLFTVFLVLAAVDFPLYVPTTALVGGVLAGLCVRSWGSTGGARGSGRSAYHVGMGDRQRTGGTGGRDVISFYARSAGAARVYEERDTARID